GSAAALPPPAFGVTEMEVSVYSGSRFVLFLDPAIPDYILLNKTSFGLCIGQAGVPAFGELLFPIPRHALGRKNEVVGQKYGLKFALYDPAKEAKLDVWLCRDFTARSGRMQSRRNHSLLRNARLASRLKNIPGSSSQIITHLTSEAHRLTRRSTDFLRAGSGGSIRKTASSEEKRHPARTRTSLSHSLAGTGFGASRPGVAPTGRWDLARKRGSSLPDLEARKVSHSLSSAPLACFEERADAGAQRSFRGNALDRLRSKMSAGRGPPQSREYLTSLPEESLQFKPESIPFSAGHSAPLDMTQEQENRRDFSESFDLPCSRGSNLFFLVLTHPVSGARVVVCVRKKVIAGSTYVIFFEATRGVRADRASSFHMAYQMLPDLRLPLGYPSDLSALAAGPHWAMAELRRGNNLLKPAVQKVGSAVPPESFHLFHRGGGHLMGRMGHRIEGVAGRMGGLVGDAVDNVRGAGETSLAFLTALGSEAQYLALTNPLFARSFLSADREHALCEGDEYLDTDSEDETAKVMISSDVSINLSLLGAGVSLIDSEPNEILYASVEMLGINYDATADSQRVRLTVGWVQVDNHAKGAYYPTMLRPITDWLTSADSLQDPREEKELGTSVETPLPTDLRGADANADRLSMLGGKPHGRRERDGVCKSARAEFRDPQHEAPTSGEMREDPESGRDSRKGTSGAGMSARPCEARVVNGSRLSRGDTVFVGSRRRLRSRFGTMSSNDYPGRDSGKPQWSRLHAGDMLPSRVARLARLHHSEQSGRLMDERDAVAQVLIEHRTSYQAGRGLVDMPQCLLRLEPLSVNIDSQLVFAVLLFLDDLLRTLNVDLLQQSVKDIRTSEVDPSSPVWRALLGPVSGILSEVIRGEQGGAAGQASVVQKVYISNLDIGRIVLVINIRNKRQGREEEEQPESELIRGVLAIVKNSLYISDANLVFAPETQQNLCGPPVALISDILQRYIGQAIKQIFQLLGAVDLFGNPMVLLKHWKSGGKRCAKEFQRGMHLYYAPPAACVALCRAFGICGLACIAGVVDSLGRFFGSWYQCLEFVARNTDVYSVFPQLVAQGGLMDQPSNIAEGLMNGGRGLAFTLGLSLMNFCVKPWKATQMHMSVATGDSSDRLLAGLKGCLLGSLSGLGSLCCGLPSSLLLFTSATCVGALNQIQAVPMLEAVRPRRIFNVGSLRFEEYSYLLSRAREFLPKQVRNNPNNQLLAVIPLALRTSYDPSSKALTSERIQRLAKRMARVSTVTPYCRRTPARRFLAVGCKKVGYVESGRVVWSCMRNQIVQVELIESISGDGSASYFLRIKHFTDLARAKVEGAAEDSLARRVKDGFTESRRRNRGAPPQRRDDESSSTSSSEYRDSNGSLSDRTFYEEDGSTLGSDQFGMFGSSGVSSSPQRGSDVFEACSGTPESVNGFVGRQGSTSGPRMAQRSSLGRTASSFGSAGQRLRPVGSLRHAWEDFSTFSQQGAARRDSPGARLDSQGTGNSYNVVRLWGGTFASLPSAQTPRRDSARLPRTRGDVERVSAGASIASPGSRGPGASEKNDRRKGRRPTPAQRFGSRRSDSSRGVCSGDGKDAARARRWTQGLFGGRDRGELSGDDLRGTGENRDMPGEPTETKGRRGPRRARSRRGRHGSRRNEYRGNDEEAEVADAEGSDRSRFSPSLDSDSDRSSSLPRSSDENSDRRESARRARSPSLSDSSPLQSSETSSDASDGYRSYSQKSPEASSRSLLADEEREREALQMPELVDRAARAERLPFLPRLPFTVGRRSDADAARTFFRQRVVQVANYEMAHLGFSVLTYFLDSCVAPGTADATMSLLV
ncbi:hypothetical protein TGP89_306020B, partial [Toxoplasma gondii p89]